MTRPFVVLPRRAALIPLAAGIIGLVAACDPASPATPVATPAATSPTTSHHSAPPTTRPTRNFNNRNLTVREVRRLVVLANLPPARTPLFAAPDNLSQPLSVPNGGSLIDTHRFWRVGIGIAAARRWVAEHPPIGLHPAGTSSGVMFGSPTVYGYHYNDEDSAAWTEASLQIAIVSAGHGTTLWRVDAMALWLDNKPARVPRGGRRLAFTVRSGCPRVDHGAVSVPSSGRDGRLLPAGRPTEALVCRYSGAGRLTSHTRLRETAAARLADLTTRVSFGHVDDRVIRCPMDNGPHLAIGFDYPDGHDAALWFRASGCPAIDNGTVFVGVGPGSHALFAALAKLR